MVLDHLQVDLKCRGVLLVPQQDIGHKIEHGTALLVLVRGQNQEFAAETGDAIQVLGGVPAYAFLGDFFRFQVVLVDVEEPEKQPRQPESCFRRSLDPRLGTASKPEFEHVPTAGDSLADGFLAAVVPTQVLRDRVIECAYFRQSFRAVLRRLLDHLNTGLGGWLGVCPGHAGIPTAGPIAARAKTAEQSDQGNESTRKACQVVHEYRLPRQHLFWPVKVPGRQRRRRLICYPERCARGSPLKS